MLRSDREAQFILFFQPPATLELFICYAIWLFEPELE